MECPRCNAPLTAEITLCPVCKLDFGLFDPTPPRPSSPAGIDPATPAAAKVPVESATSHTYRSAAERLMERHPPGGAKVAGTPEWYARLVALPIALAGAWLIAQSSAFRVTLRLLAGMWLHEFGHATTAWLCGYPAFPGPWFTPIAANRSVLLSLLVSAGCAAVGILAWGTGRNLVAAAMVALLAAQVTCSATLTPDRAHELIIFGGDAGAMVWGTLAMSTLYTPVTSKLRRDWLRWGLLPLGAMAFMDVFEQWWASRTDVDRIMFGHNEGQGPSDPSLLSDTYHWSVPQLVEGYVSVGYVCLAVLGILYLRGISQRRVE